MMKMMRLKSKYYLLKRRLREIAGAVKCYRACSREVRSMPDNAVILWAVPLYGNLGDQAITYAEAAFLSTYLPKRPIMPIPEEKCAQYLYPLKRFAGKKGMLFVLPGGGNMGQLYRYQEERRQMLIRHIKDCPLIAFPQSVDFQEGTRAHAKARRRYQSNPNLRLYARDKVNYEKMKALFPQCRVSLTPDIVAALDKRSHSAAEPALDVIYCLRSDKEANAAYAEAIGQIKACLDGKKAETMDTYGAQFVTAYENQAAQLENFWNRMRSAKLIVTDRLHGMIFAMITNTPCVAFDNSTGKVAAFYNTWLREVPGILLYRGDLSAAERFVQKVYGEKGGLNAYIDLSAEFEPLKENLKEYM